MHYIWTTGSMCSYRAVPFARSLFSCKLLPINTNEAQKHNRASGPGEARPGESRNTPSTSPTRPAVFPVQNVTRRPIGKWRKGNSILVWWYRGTFAGEQEKECARRGKS